jgi:HNH endonuclease
MRLRGKGYLFVSLQGEQVDVAVVVCETFHGPKPSPGMQAAHDDGDKRNNSVSNVAWKTAKENAADRKRHGTQQMGSRVVWSKLTEDKVREIREKRANGVTMADLGREYGVAYQTIQSMLRGRSWAHVR